MMSIWFVTATLIAFFLGSQHSATFLAVGESVSPATGLRWVGGLGPSFGKAGPDFSGPVNYRALKMELSQELNDRPSAGTFLRLFALASVAVWFVSLGFVVLNFLLSY